jgi:hypothetical protein
VHENALFGSSSRQISDQQAVARGPCGGVEGDSSFKETIHDVNSKKLLTLQLAARNARVLTFTLKIVALWYKRK